MGKKRYHWEQTGDNSSLFCYEETLIDYFLKNEETYRDLFQNDRTVVLLIDQSTCKIIDANHTASEFYGWSLEELKKMDISDIDAVIMESRKGKENSSIECKNAGDKNYFFSKHMLSSGEVRDVKIYRSDPLKKEKDVNYVVVRDVTEQKRTEKDLHLAFFALENAFDPVVWVKSNGQMFYVNKAACNLLGYTEEELLSMSVSDVNPNFTSSMWDEHWINVRSNKTYFNESSVRTKSGNILPVEITVNYLNYKGEEYHCTFFRNITKRKNAEEELKKASHSLENSKDAVAWLEKNGNVFYVNKAACDLTGYSKDEMLSMSVFSFDPELTQESWKEHWEKLCNEKTSLAEVDVRTNSGEMCPVEIISNYMNYEGKEYDCTFIRDLTERKKTEKGLNLACFSLENFSDAVFWTRKTGEFFFANKSACDLLGYSKEELLTMSVPDIDPVFTEDMWNEHWKLVTEKKSFTFHSMHLTKEKRLLPVEISVNHMIYGEEEYNCAIIKDISERLKSENALSEEVHWRRLLMEQSRDGMVILEMDGSVFETNPAFAEMLGYTVSEIQNMYVWDWDANFDRDHLLNMIQSSDFQGILFETKQKCKDGTILNVEINSNLMAYSGKKLVFCVCRDITERKKYSDELLKAKITAEEASLAKNEFLATMSHELRTPLNSIIGFSEIIKGGDFGEINEAQTEYIDYISKSGKHLLNVINDILDLSKIEAGRVELNYEKFNLSDSINEIKMSVTPMAMKKGVDLELKYNSLPEMIFADRTKFKEIIYNLASNAIKFTPENGKVTIEAGTVDSSVYLNIQDTGIGISLNDMDKLFQPFRQIKPCLNHDFKGSGLGLAIAKKFIEMHGGSISVQSNPGEGSSFVFRIPKEPEYDNINIEQTD
ncbi:PAS domain S-box protein [Methanolobus bombayensis]|uniref:PAS domain S-box protein n=1 Tax=Methanolobus bombayensis TaxID=38023 RepID=UPI001AE20C0E|nr:PAS domain S-box protein [Methanolobus bombayensis]MBP1908344.1 PAS domain S-box-containing protein [Methanolobus bombayensis]